MENDIFKILDYCCHGLINVRENLDCYDLLSDEGKERLNALESELYELMYDKDGMQRRYKVKYKIDKEELSNLIKLGKEHKRLDEVSR